MASGSSRFRVPNSRSPKRRAQEDDREGRALKLREDIVKAVAWRRVDQLGLLAKRALRLQVDRHVLEATGIGMLLSDTSLWAMANDPQVAATAAAAAESWRREFRGRHLPVEATVRLQSREVPRPLGGKKAGPFLKVVEALDSRAGDMEPTATPMAVRTVAVAVALRGFEKLEDLEGVAQEETATWISSPAGAALLRKLTHKVWLGSVRRRAQERAATAAEEALQTQPACAEAFAASLSEEQQGAAERAVANQFEEAGVVGLGSSLRPHAATAALEAARDQGHDVLQLLDRRGAQLQLETRRRSLGSAASALRAWHGFAVAMLGYEAARTLPPRSEQDVVRWVSTFRNFGTAANYVGFLRWAARALDLGLEWDGQRIGMTLKGGKKWALRNVGSEASARRLLTEDLVLSVTHLSESLGIAGFKAFLLFSWELLARVADEAVPAQCGSAEDVLHLPAGRHSAVYIDQGTGSLTVHWRTRKHRPNGSVLRRPCTCQSKGRDRCMPHAVAKWAVQSGACVGQRLWPWAPAAARKILTRMLALLAVPDADRFTWKAVRAGKATAMAAGGYRLQEILMAGEWRSRALFAYVDSDAADHAELLRQTLVHESSDSEAE